GGAHELDAIEIVGDRNPGSRAGISCRGLLVAPGVAAVGGGDDLAPGADRPALGGTHKRDVLQFAAAAGVLHAPGSAAVRGLLDLAAVADRPTRARADERAGRQGAAVGRGIGPGVGVDGDAEREADGAAVPELPGPGDAAMRVIQIAVVPVRARR